MAKEKRIRLKLEAGKRYVRRDGGITEPLVDDECGGLVDGLFGNCYDPADKGWSMGSLGHYRSDLVAEHKGAIDPHESASGGRAVEDLIKAVCVELQGARSSFPAFNSLHEGFSILNEEVDELWEEVKKKQSSKERPVLAKKEAIQVAAMALRLILDCCEKGSPGYGK